jgi:hypothetical protein
MAAAPFNSWAARRASLPPQLRERRRSEYSRERRAFAMGATVGGFVTALCAAIAIAVLMLVPRHLDFLPHATAGGSAGRSATTSRAATTSRPATMSRPATRSNPAPAGGSAAPRRPAPSRPDPSHSAPEPVSTTPRPLQPSDLPAGVPTDILPAGVPTDILTAFQ